MQQVTSGARFWWRAHDAPEPQTPASAVSYLWPSAVNVRGATPVARNALFLEVPRGERRHRLASRRTRRKFRAIAGLSLIALGVTAAGIAATSNAVASIDLSSAAASKTRDLMVAAGFGIDQVSITGQRYALDSDIFDALDLPNVRTFADLDMAAALKRIERISWVNTAQITRVFPSSLAINIEERTPAVIWSRGGKDYLLDISGRVLGPVPAANNWKLPRVMGEGAEEDATLLLGAVHRYPEIAKAMAYAERIAERRWRIVYANGSRIELAADRESEGLERIMSRPHVRRSLASCAIVADVRTPGRIALRPIAPDAKPFGGGQ